ncbi:MAG: hypothetical protein WA975_10855 [Mesorhizobium sp.]
MGVLRDTDYWRDTVRQMEPFRPIAGQAPSPEDTLHILRIACSAFTSLVNDPALHDDLSAMVNDGVQAARRLPEGTDALRGYLIAFRQVEIEILRSARVPESAITVMDDAIAALVNRGGVDWSDFEAVEEKLRFLRERVCEHAADASFAKGAPPSLGALVRDATAGTLVGAVDLGVVVAGAVATVGAAPAVATVAATAGAGALAALSLTIPLAAWNNLVRRFRS